MRLHGHRVRQAKIGSQGLSFHYLNGYVLVWRYDRFARSTPALVNALKEFQSLGIDFISYQEHIDTTTPQGELIFTVMASLAQFESALMSERVKAGMARAKAQGKRISRAPIARSIQTRIAL